MKALKTKLVAAVVMLLVATIMMTSASFAWFTISTAPEVQNLDVSITATKNLEIAWIKEDNLTEGPSEVFTGQQGNYDYWGAVVAFSSGQGGLDFPAAASDSDIKTIEYDSTGRVKQELQLANPGAFVDGIRTYTHEVYSGQNKTVAVTYGVWLRTNIDGNITVTKTSNTNLVKANNEGSFAATGDEAEAKTALEEALTIQCSYESLADASDKGTLSLESGTASFHMTANEKYKVFITVYFDGSELMARHIAWGAQASDFGVKFESDAVTDNGIVWTAL